MKKYAFVGNRCREYREWILNLVKNEFHCTFVLMEKWTWQNETPKSWKATQDQRN